MPKTLVVYATKDGHTAKIAYHVARAVRSLGCEVDVIRVVSKAAAIALDRYDGVIVGGPIHFGRHAKSLRRFIIEHRACLNEHPSAFFSASLSAAGNEEQRDDAKRCLRALLDRTQWQPRTTAIVAGALLYRQYGFLKRWLMRRVAEKAGGDVDVTRNHEYTNWRSLDRFAEIFVRALKTHGAIAVPDDVRPASTTI